MTQLDDNFDAVMAKASGAPVLANNYIVQAMISSSAVGQGQLKSTTGFVSTTSIVPQLLTLPGGQYGFYPEIHTSVVGAYQHASIAADVYANNSGVVTAISRSWPLTFETRITLGSDGTVTSYAQQRYLQASPPYDLGDGEVPLFVFVEVDSSGAVISAYVAPEAPWHYNGPTDIRATAGYRNGIGYRHRKDAAEIDGAMVAAGHAPGLTLAAAAAAGPSVLADYRSAFAAAPEVEEEITQAIKNADMGLIPRPMVPSPGNTVIMLDPVAGVGITMAEMMQHEGFSLNTLLHDSDIIIDNTAIARSGPPGVAVHPWRLR